MSEESKSEGLDYARLFEWRARLEAPSSRADVGDRIDGAFYRLDHDPRLQLALDVALVTGRPLLLRGAPGCGKSTFALAVARRLGWRFYREVITSRTEAAELMYRFEAVRRLADAQARQLQSDDKGYIKPGPLWWAFDRQGAAEHLYGDAESPQRGPDLNPDPPGERPHLTGLPAMGAVVLLDEIDKAETDLPNDLLVPLGALEFGVPHVKDPVCLRGAGSEARCSPVLVVVTTNEERDLPPAFLRRCVVHQVATPDPGGLADIARLHYGDEPEGQDDLYAAVAKRFAVLDGPRGPERPVSIAEYLDAVRACRELGIRPVETDPVWQHIERLTLRKD